MYWGWNIPGDLGPYHCYWCPVAQGAMISGHRLWYIDYSGQTGTSTCHPLKIPTTYATFMVRNDRKCEDNFMFPQMISACKGFLKSNKFTIAIHMLSLTNSWLRGENHSQHIFFWVCNTCFLSCKYSDLYQRQVRLHLIPTAVRWEWKKYMPKLESI